MIEELSDLDRRTAFSERLWRLVEITPTCWNWKGGKKGSLGYGTIRLPPPSRKTVMTHRASFFLANGYLPALVRHTCDNPLCVRPDHLIEGTQQQNIDDCIERGRSRNGNIKLNPQIWEEIRQSTERSASLAEQFGVSEAHIRKIRRGTSGNVYRP